MRILFMGTPEIAAVMLRKLAKSNEICGVFCQPDKPVGRKQILTPPAVKVAAGELKIPVFQPVKLRDGEAARLVRELAPELIAVVAYGRLLPKEILDIPPRGCVNIHASLLPKYRGAAPIQRAVLAGETVSGVTAMYMDEGLDTGDIIESVPIPIDINDGAASMFEKMGEAGGELLVKTVEAIERGEAKRLRQNDADASFAPMLEKEEGLFSFFLAASEIHNRVRGMNIWPNAFFLLGERKVKVLESALSDKAGEEGEILSLNPLTVAAKGGSIELLSVKPEGSRQMTGKEFAAGLRLKIGDKLTEN